MAKYTTLTSLFTAIADAIRGKTGGTEAIVADDFPSVIDSIPTGGITPTGTKTITENGTHDVTNYASAAVNVPVPAMEIHRVVLSADKTSGEQIWVSNNTFVKNNYTKDGFAVLIVSATGTATGAVCQAFAYRGNRPYITGGATTYGTLTRATASGQGSMMSPAKLTSTDYNGSPVVDANGNVKTLTSNAKICAGTYYIVLMLLE